MTELRDQTVLSRRLTHGVRQSGARQIMDLANQLPDVIHLEIGEPDFTAAPHVVEAATKALRDGLTKYPPTAGMAELREAAAEKLLRVNKIDVAPEQVVVSNGGCEGLFAALSAVADSGQTIAVPDPGWPNYRSMAAVLGLDVVTYDLGPATSFQPDPAQLRQLLADGCRCIILCSPSNPLGTVTPRALSEQIVDLADEYGAWIISDECYDELSFGPVPFSPAAVGTGANVISVFSFSKTHAMTGWRIGYVAAPPHAAAVIAKAQEPLVLGISAPGQRGAIAALTGGTEYQEEMVAQYRRRRDAVVAVFRERGRPVTAPDGAFYLWLDIRDAGIADTDFAFGLLSTEHVAATAGSSFGTAGAGYLRLSLAASLEELVTASDRVMNHLDRVKALGADR